MALIDFMGFDTMNTTAGYTPDNWVLPYGEVVNFNDVPKTGSFYGRGYNGDQPRRNLTAAEEHATIYVGCWVSNAAGAYSHTLLRLSSDSAATHHVLYVLETDGTLNARTGTTSGTILASGASGIAVDTWRHVEFKTVLSDTVGSVSCRIDGVELFNVTNIDTKNGGTKTVFDAVFLPRVNGGSGYTRYDDWFVVNGDSASNPYTWVGGARVYSLGPSGNGSSSQFTGSDGNSTDNYLLVDESDFTPGSDYVEATADSLLDLYGMADLSLPTGADVLGVKASALALNSSTGARTIKMAVRSGGTNSIGAAQTLNTSMKIFERVMPVNPVTSAAWTPAEVNALEVGYESGS